MKIIPAILGKNTSDAVEKIQIASEFTRYIQIDLTDPMDSSVDLNMIINTLKKPHLDTVYHIMTKNPLIQINKIIGSNFHRIIPHIENITNWQDIKNKIPENKRGLAINPATNISEVFPLLDDIAELLIMTVDPGRSGQKMQKKPLEKIQKIKLIKPHIQISVDGGVNLSNIREIGVCGAHIAYVGSEIFSSQNPAATFRRLIAI